MGRLKSIVAAMKADIEKVSADDCHWAIDALEIHYRRLVTYLEDGDIADDT